MIDLVVTAEGDVLHLPEPDPGRAAKLAEIERLLKLCTPEQIEIIEQRTRMLCAQFMASGEAPHGRAN